MNRNTQMRKSLTGLTKQQTVAIVENYFKVMWHEVGHDNPFLGWGE